MIFESGFEIKPCRSKICSCCSAYGTRISCFLHKRTDSYSKITAYKYKSNKHNNKQKILLKKFLDFFFHITIYPNKYVRRIFRLFYCSSFFILKIILNIPESILGLLITTIFICIPPYTFIIFSSEKNVINPSRL